MAEQNLRRLQARPLCIICGKPAEAKYIAKRLDADERLEGSNISGVNSRHTFYLGDLALEGGKKLEYYITSSLRQGMVHFSTHASILFQLLRPRFAIHAGVCAGYGAAGVQLLQVIFGDTSTSYEEGKWVLKDGKKEFQPDFDQVRIQVSEIQAFTEGRKTFRYGDYISGLSVREDASELFEQARTSYARNVCALDMEAFAFLKLCEYTDVMSLGVVKGVSDLGDSEKGKDEAVYRNALGKTAEALDEWMRHYFDRTPLERDESNEPGAKLARPYYDNFVRHVVEAIHRGEPMASVAADGTHHLITESPRGMKIIMPNGFDVNQYAEQGMIYEMAQERDIQEVVIGPRSWRRTMYYKNRYLIDFPRTLNSLLMTPDPEYQALVFEKVLKTLGYCKAAENSPNRLMAEVITWSRFETLFGSNDGSKSPQVLTPSDRTSLSPEPDTTSS